MHTIPLFKLLVDELYKMQREIYNEEFIDGEPKLGNMWANINYKDSFNRPHVHSNSLFSGAYYVKAPKILVQKLMILDKELILLNLLGKMKSPEHLWI